MDLAVMNMSKWDNTMPWRAVLTQIVAVKQHDIIHLSTPPSLSLSLCLSTSLSQNRPKTPMAFITHLWMQRIKKKRMQMKI